VTHAGGAGLVVVKLGGSLLAHPAALDRVLELLAAVARRRPVAVVPGGGPFADAVRALDARLHLHPTTAHWMAVRAMDQYAELLAARLPGARLVASHAAVAGATAVGAVAVLAPHAELRAADPLPHGWDVTADSVAAWVAGALGADALVLVKAPGAPRDGAMDPYFPQALPAGLAHHVVPADRLDHLASALGDAR
jgi:aspartokinase-like uncharacterized kinase